MFGNGIEEIKQIYGAHESDKLAHIQKRWKYQIDASLSLEICLNSIQVLQLDTKPTLKK